jgi:hypothetical protein
MALDWLFSDLALLSIALPLNGAVCRAHTLQTLTAQAMASLVFPSDMVAFGLMHVAPRPPCNLKQYIGKDAQRRTRCLLHVSAFACQSFVCVTAQELAPM